MAPKLSVVRTATGMTPSAFNGIGITIGLDVNRYRVMGIARIPQSVTIKVLLIRVSNGGAVVARIRNPVAIGIGHHGDLRGRFGRRHLHFAVAGGVRGGADEAIRFAPLPRERCTGVACQRQGGCKAPVVDGDENAVEVDLPDLIRAAPGDGELWGGSFNSWVNTSPNFATESTSVSIRTALHFPAPPAVKMSRISCAVRARL